ncbi:MAG TPA: zf-HC2 domain-containing protein [Bryobacteraceae bacterium]|nr:zf-HC2 domain-containing protein [Bryobacteraceae bacterium]
MNCGDFEELAPLWHSGELDGERRREFDAHVSGCAACAADLREQETVDEQLRESVIAEPADTRAIEEHVRRRIARGRIQRWVMPGLAAAAALIAVALWRVPRATPAPTPINPAIVADAVRDHTAELVNHAPRRWRADASEISTIEKSQGIEDQDVKALEATGYHLQRAKICRLGGAPWIHLVYARDGREFSVYMRVREDQSVPDSAASSGDLQLASFTHGRVQAVIVTDAPKGECAKFAKDAEHALL